MIHEAGFFFMKADIDPFAYGEMGIFDNNEYVNTSVETWEKWAKQPPRDAVLPLKRSSPLPDLLVGMPYYCLSERAHGLFVHHLIIWQRITWIPVRALDRKKQEVGRYWWPMHASADYVDVLDYTNSKVEFYPPEYGLKPKTVRKVIRWVLDSRAIGDLDFFMGNEWQWFASPKVRQLVIDAKLTGFEFLPVAVST